jgi:hypothetical protein
VNNFIIILHPIDRMWDSLILIIHDSKGTQSKISSSSSIISQIQSTSEWENDRMIAKLWREVNWEWKYDQKMAIKVSFKQKECVQWYLLANQDHQDDQHSQS